MAGMEKRDSEKSLLEKQWLSKKARARSRAMGTSVKEQEAEQDWKEGGGLKWECATFNGIHLTFSPHDIFCLCSNFEE